MLIAVLFIIAKCWKYHKYPSSGEWIKKIVIFDIMEYYSTTKGKKLLMCTKKWMNLKRVNAKGEKPDTKYYIRYDFIYMEF